MNSDDLVVLVRHMRQVLLMLLYVAFVAPVETAVAMWQYGRVNSRDKDNGWKLGYASHVGFAGDYLLRVLRCPTAVLGLSHEQPLMRVLFVLGSLLPNYLVQYGEGLAVKWISFSDSLANARRGAFVAADKAHLSLPPSRVHVLLYFHGGGFVCGTPVQSFGHSALLAHAVNRKLTNGLKLVTFAVEYPLSPENSNDATIETCLEAYKFLVSQNYTSISIGGDSAGANAALNVLSLLSSAHHDLVQPVSALLYSPWVDPFVTILPPNYPNEVSFYHDVLSVPGSKKMASLFAPTASLEMRVKPLDWPIALLDACIPKKGGVLVLYGGADGLRAGIDAFVDKLDGIVGGAAGKNDGRRVVKKRYPFMPHCFNIFFLSSIGVSKKTAMQSVEASAQFLVEAIGE